MRIRFELVVSGLDVSEAKMQVVQWDASDNAPDDCIAYDNVKASDWLQLWFAGELDDETEMVVVNEWEEQ